MKQKEISIEEVFNKERQRQLNKFISLHAGKQSKKEVLENKLLGIRFTLEDYIHNEDENIEIMVPLDFVKMYLNVLNLTKKKLANYFEMSDSNLQKYLSGERKLNADLVLKLAAFSHTKPEYWFQLQVKNELIALKKEKKNFSAYQKFDYRQLIET